VKVEGMDLPLGDIRVIDLTIARAGPSCVRQLADWGADVIRVEPPGVSDPLGGDRHGSDFQQVHRNKRAVSLNLKSPASGDVLMRLVDSADDPQVRHLEMAQAVDHPARGPIDLVRNPVRMTGAAGAVLAPAPDPGEHTDDVLTDLGYSAAEIGKLRADTVI
jgi:crotonobetainyl-CoA:carnitine CoA-transferase CaiB-like acyl-CoA transferase